MTDDLEPVSDDSGAPLPPVQQEVPLAETPPPAPAKRAGSGVAVAVAAAVVVSVLVGAFAGALAGFWGARFGLMTLQGGRTIINAPDKITVIPDKTSDPVVAASVVAVPSVVNIDVTSGPTKKDGAKDLPSTHPNVPSTGNGSGVAYKAAEGGGTYVLTNNHVVEDAAKIVVREPGGKKWPAELVGRDPETDIAVVKIKGDLPGIGIANSNQAQVGQYVVAIGSPFGLEHSVTFGVISAIGRSLPEFGVNASGTYPLVDVIQTDAAINPGNSGGALVDRAGKLVGINTAIYGGDGRNAGIGFAIPSNTAVRVAEQLIGKGEVDHPFLGIVGQSVDSANVGGRDLGTDEGALVIEFSPGSTAEKGGLKAGDVVIAINGEPVRSMDDLILLVRRNKVGDTVKLGILRNGKEMTLSVKVGEKPASLEATPSETTTK